MHLLFFFFIDRRLFQVLTLRFYIFAVFDMASESRVTEPAAVPVPASEETVTDTL